MAKELKKRVTRLEAQVESLTKKVQALGRMSAKKTPRHFKAAARSSSRKAKPIVNPASLSTASATTQQSGAPNSSSQIDPPNHSTSVLAGIQS